MSDFNLELERKAFETTHPSFLILNRKVMVDGFLYQYTEEIEMFDYSASSNLQSLNAAWTGWILSLKHKRP